MNIRLWFCIIALLPVNWVDGVNVPATDIDFERSEFRVVSFDPAHELTPPFRCFEQASSVGGESWQGKATRSFKSLGLDGTSIDFVSSIDDCFQQSGRYGIVIDFWDKAGNQQTYPSFLDILPSDPEIVSLRQLEACGADDLAPLAADGSTECEVELVVEDRFGNRFTGFGLQDYPAAKMAVEGQALRSVFDFSDLEAVSEQELFRDGVEFGESIRSLDGLGRALFNLRARAPSLVIKSGAFGFEQLSHLSSYVVNFEIALPLVNDDGSLDLSRQKLLDSTLELAFSPAFKTVLAYREEVGGLIDFGDQRSIEVSSESSFWPEGVGIEVEIQPIAPHGARWDIVTGSGSVGGNRLSFENLDTQYRSFTLEPDSGISPRLDVGFGSFISEERSNGDVIRYPSGNLGRAGFDVEDLSSEDCQGCEMSDLKINPDQSDLYVEDYFSAEETKALSLKVGGVYRDKDLSLENIKSIIRGIKPKQANLLTTQDLFFTPENPLLYVKNGTVRLSGYIQGQGLLVVENGNVFINGDLYYQQPGTDHLGIVLINQSGEKEPATGNVFVHQDVQHFVGDYQLDGALLSTVVSRSGLPRLDESIIFEDFSKQLVLEGSLESYNTVGGAFASVPETPWGTASDLNNARRYDLQWMRDYQSSEGLEGCAKVGRICEQETASFIIRPYKSLTSFREVEAFQ